MGRLFVEVIDVVDYTVDRQLPNISESRAASEAADVANHYRQMVYAAISVRSIGKHPLQGTTIGLFSYHYETVQGDENTNLCYAEV